MIKFSLPLALNGFGDGNARLKAKLFLIKKFKLADPDTLIQMLKMRSSEAELSVADRRLIEKLWQSSALNDLDVTELFVCYLPQIIDQQNKKFLASLDPSTNRNQRAQGENYEKWVKGSVKVSAQSVRRVAIPRVRAKLALREIICLITSDLKKVSELIQITPRYLCCTVMIDLLARYKVGQHSSDAKIRQRSDLALDRITKSLKGTRMPKPRRYGYWRVDYFFTEVLACIQTANEMTEEGKRQRYVRSVERLWALPEGYAEILAKKVKNPAEIVLEMMVVKKMIVDASTYRNVIKPHVKKIKDQYPSIRACDYLVEHLLDLPTKDPDKFSQFDIWKQLEDFEFDLTDKEVEIGHAISYPIHAVMV